ncbi:mucin-22-like isoform X3 [Thunnus thynnus]|uniref:mucin-22-like isoform X3 n=1 Tax=Thunnus thynnus TaxID=8237 RepID=UPI003526ECB1
MRERSRMVEFRRIQMLFLILVLQFSADITGQHSSFTVRDGDEVTLHCENVTTDQDKCDSTTWLFGGSGSTTVVLIKLGQIGEEAKAKSDRLSVTANCSLVIKKVTVEDVGSYFCRQFKSGQKQGLDSHVDLSVVTMTEHKNNNEVTLSCSVSTYDGQCKHTVKWVYQGKDVDKDIKDLKTSQSTCSVTVSFLTSHFICTSNHEFLKCEVTDPNNRKVQLYNFSPQLSCEKPGEEGKTTTTQPTTTTNENITESRKKTGVSETTTEPETTTSTTQEDADATTATTESTTIQSSTKAATTTTSATKDATITSQDCSALSYIMLVMHVAELLLITVITVLLFRARGNQRPPDDNIDLNSVRSRTAKRSGPAASQEQNDEDDGAVNYENFGEPSTSVRLH